MVNASVIKLLLRLLSISSNKSPSSASRLYKLCENTSQPLPTQPTPPGQKRPIPSLLVIQRSTSMYVP